MCGARSAASSTPDSSTVRRCAEARPEELDVDAWCRLTARREQRVAVSSSDRRRPSSRSSLRVTGCRDDGYHLIDAEMVTLDLARRPDDDPHATGHLGRGPFAAGVPIDEGRTSLTARRGSTARGGECTWSSRFRTVVGSAAVRPTRPPCCDGRGITDPVGPQSRWVPTCRSVCPAAGPGDRHRRGWSSRSPPVDADRHARRPTVDSDAGSVPGVGRARRTAAEPGPTISRRRRSRGARTRTVARPHRRRGRADAELAGSGATWFVGRPPRQGPRRGCSPRGPGSSPPSAGGDTGSGTRAARHVLLTTLVASTPQHLLVLLLPHALAALLDQRTHKVGHASGWRLIHVRPLTTDTALP